MNSPDTWIIDGDVYCTKCANAMAKRNKLIAPAGPYSDQESDSPSHCGCGDSCKDRENWSETKKPWWVGKFFENPLTTHGATYVQEMHRDRPSDVTRRWMAFYSL